MSSGVAHIRSGMTVPPSLDINELFKKIQLAAKNNKSLLEILCALVINRWDDLVVALSKTKKKVSIYDYLQKATGSSESTIKCHELKLTQFKNIGHSAGRHDQGDCNNTYVGDCA